MMGFCFVIEQKDELDVYMLALLNNSLQIDIH
jgi:hypothetical protein